MLTNFLITIVLPSIVIPSFLFGEVAKTPALESVVPAIILRFFGKGISNHKLLGNWLSGGASNAGAAILLDFFDLEYIQELSKQINPYKSTGIDLIPLSKKGERFPTDDPNLQPKLDPRPVSDSLYLHAILEGLAKIEARGWQKLHELGAEIPRQIITIGGGAKNIAWKKIREKEIGIPIKICNRPPAAGVAIIALQALL